MRIMRLNFSHATYEEASLRIQNLRKSHGVHSQAIGAAFNLRGNEREEMTPPYFYASQR